MKYVDPQENRCIYDDGIICVNQTSECTFCKHNVFRPKVQTTERKPKQISLEEYLNEKERK